jgi:hypothetical protein
MEYEIEIKRTSFIEYTVKANTKEEAEQKALDMAAEDHGDCAEYEVVTE